MKKLLKFVVILGVLGLVCVFGLLLFINPILDKLKPQITKKISEVVEQPVVLGDMSLQFFPSIGVAIDGAGLADKSGNLGDAASIRSLVLSAPLMDLVRGNITVSRFTLEGVRVSALRKADGTIYVGDLPLTKKQGSTPPPSNPGGGGGAPGPSTPPAKAKDPAVNFNFEAISISDTKISWKDEMVSPSVEVGIEDISLSAEGIGVGKQGTVDFSASILGTSSRNMTLKGVVGLQSQLFAIPVLDLDFQFADLDLSRVIELGKSYGVDVKGLSLEHDIDFGAKITSSVQNGIKVIPRFDATNTAIAFQQLFSKKQGVTLDFKADVQPSLPSRVSIQDLVFRMGTLVWNSMLDLDITSGGKHAFQSKGIELANIASFVPPAAAFKPVGAIDVDGEIVVGLDSQKTPRPSLAESKLTLSLQDIGAVVPLGGEQEQQKTLPLSALDGTIALLKDELTIKPLSFRLAEQPFSYELVAQGVSKNPQVNATFSSNKFEVGKLLTAVAGPTPISQAKFESLKVTQAYLHENRSGEVVIKLGKGILAPGASIQSIAIPVFFELDQTYQPKAVSIKKGDLKVFGGQVTLNAKVKKLKNIGLVMRASGLDVGQLSAVAVGDAPYAVEGTLNQCDLTVAGKLPSLPKTVSGEVDVKITKGAIKGLNILRQVLDKLKGIPGVNAAVSSYVPPEHSALLAGNATPFDSLTLGTSFKAPHGNLQQFELLHGLYEIGGRGKYSFDGNFSISTELRITPLLTTAMVLKQPKLKLLTERNGVMVIPVVIKRVKGKMLVLPDMESLLKRAAKSTVKEVGKEALDKVAPGLGGALDSLF